MSVAGVRNRDSFGTVAGPYRVLAGNTGLITLVPAPLLSTIYVQKIHIQITTPSVGELWTFQDGAGIPLVPAVSAGAIAHFDFNFGPDGVPCTPGTAFVLNITGATGAVGWITWSAYQQLTGVGYVGTILADGPSNYWRLNETSGLTAFDIVGGKHGTISGGVTLNQPGPLASGDKAMAFDGVNGKIVTAAPVSLVVPWTFECWLNYLGDTYNPLFQTTAPPPNAQNLITLYVGPNGQLTWRRYPAGSSSSEQMFVSFPFQITLGWHHLVIVTASVPLLYVDGMMPPPVGTVTPPENVSQTVEFGAITWQAIFLHGSLDEIALYPYALTAQQILAHFQAASRP